MSKVLWNKEGTVWMTQEFKDGLDKMQEEIDTAFAEFMLTGKLPQREPKEDDNVKLAWVLINGKRTMLGVDNKTLLGYKLKETCPAWKLPLEEVKYDSFDRWCTSFDV
jgi:hypothetical protein